MSKKKLPARLKRHGWAGWLETSLGSCPCGAEKWYACIHSTTYDGSAHNVEINYPACHRCFGSKSSQRAHTAYGQHHPGLDERKTSRRDLHTHEECRDALVWTIALVTGKVPELEPGIEAYMFYNQWMLKNYPHIATDYYWACVTYWPEDGTIRRHATGETLIKFPAQARREWDVNHFMHCDEVLPYANEIDEAYREYLKDHNHRGQPMDDARGWLAWLLGEYLMDRDRFYPDITDPRDKPPNIAGQRLDSIVQNGIWQPVQA